MPEELTLREKLDALEAIEVLIKYLEADVEQAHRDELAAGASEDYAGPDFVQPARRRVERAKETKERILRSIANDPTLAVFSDEKNKGMGL